MKVYRFLFVLAAIVLILPSLASAQDKVMEKDAAISVPGFPFDFTGIIRSSEHEVGANYFYSSRWWGVGEYEGETYHFTSKFSAVISAANGAVPSTMIEKVTVIKMGEGPVEDLGFSLVAHFTYNAVGELVVDFTFEK